MKIETGSLISEEIAEVVRRNTGQKDMAIIAANNGVSVSTLRDVLRRMNPITDKTKAIIPGILEVALENARKSMNNKVDDIERLESIIEEQEIKEST